MAELTEQEVQEMIQKAREGDAEANYRMSEWALEQAMAEPEEERWNRLAAKCLVKAAEAGYAPAQDRMDELIHQLEEDDKAAAAARESYEEDYPATEEAYSEKQPAQRKDFSAWLQTARNGAAKAWTKTSAFVKDIFKKPEEDEDDGGKPGEAVSGGEEKTGGARTRASGKHAGGLASYFRFSEWDAAKWKKMQRICLIVAVALVILIIIVVASGRGDKEEAVVEETATPVAETIAPVQPTATPVVNTYPDDSVRAAIEAADLDVFPSDDEYVSEATTMTVKTNGSDLRSRKGNSTNYSIVSYISNGTSLEVYAIKSNWALVVYDGKYGWCSTEYLQK